MHTTETFRAASRSFLAPSKRVARARLMMQLSHLARVEGDAFAAKVRMVHPDDEGSRARALYAHSDRLKAEAARLHTHIRNIGDALVDVAASFWTMQDESDRRSAVECRVSDYIYGDKGRVLGGRYCTVGHYRTATSDPLARSFACLDVDGTPIAARGTPTPWAVSDEWSPDRAAAIFVATEGVDGAIEIMDLVEDKTVDPMWASSSDA